MVKRIVHVPGNPGDNVIVPSHWWTEDVGIHGTSWVSYLIEMKTRGLFSIAVRSGVLKGKDARNQFNLCTHKLLNDTDINNETKIGLRTAVQKQSK